eukprot:scaffold870_cov268-Pinguiococcus_pyrenoidosus.AAC.85
MLQRPPRLPDMRALRIERIPERMTDEPRGVEKRRARRNPQVRRTGARPRRERRGIVWFSPKTGICHL